MHTKNADPKAVRRAMAALNMGDNHLAALLLHLDNPDLSSRDVEDLGYSGLYGEGSGFAADGEEYAVLSEDQADRAWEAALQSYLDECVLPEVPESMRSYFDEDAWKEDARTDGRGHALSSYDGAEHEVTIDGEWYFIYRTN